VSATVGDRPWREAAGVARLVAGFEACSLPKAEWTHRAHLTVALWYLSRMPAEEALERVRDGIRRYNVATGGANTETSGYHETITRFYVWLVGHFVREECRSQQDLVERANRLFDRYGARDLPLRHWSEARLMSPQARAGWVDPDLRPLTG